MPPATIAETLKQASQQLRAASVVNDVLDAQMLLAEALGKDRTYLIVNFNDQLSEESLSTFQRLLARRTSGEPVQYIIGHQQFFGLEFEVTPDVLIPRPETELIVEETIRLVEEHKLASPVIVDVGTGSGCIAVALARELETAQVTGCDISEAALAVARRNAAKHDLADRVQFTNSNLLSAFPETPFADFILSNPPYVAQKELPTLQREVYAWEPHLALTDFGDGLSLYRRLLDETPSRLKVGGYLICELGYSQSEAVSAMADSQIWEAQDLLNDLQGIPRTLVLRKR
ncbi:MAG: peptide chain release factor N(5)-glutamine methyltransferase [Acidobacteria bacterium]|nr:peptide chain release factor N(5)-glutamine methyltransferase [Acidobacteriota bacterium]